MQEFASAFVLFGIVLAGMAIGVIFSNRCIKGSCGGVGSCVCGRHGEEDSAVPGQSIAEPGSQRGEQEEAPASS